MDNDEVAINFALTQKPKSKDKKINETIIRPNTKEGWTFVEIFRLYFFFFFGWGEKCVTLLSKQTKLFTVGMILLWLLCEWQNWAWQGNKRKASVIVIMDW